MRKRRVITETTASTIGSNTLTVEKIPPEENKEEKLPHITIFELKRILMLLSFYFNLFILVYIVSLQISTTLLI